MSSVILFDSELAIPEPEHQTRYRIGTQSKSNRMNIGIINRYRSQIPLAQGADIVTLGEGSTPLLPLERISRHIGGNVQLLAKVEGMNPTGSFKDRGMTVAISQALCEGAKAVVCASTGNTSASAAAYAGRAGLRCFVLIPEGKIALGKLAQANVHGAVVVQIRGNFDKGLELVRELPEQVPITIVNSINPWRIHGQKTGAFEIVDDLGAAPNYHCLPVGNAGNITAYWKGYCEYLREGMQRPVMVGYQASGAAPLIRGTPVETPETVATAIRIGNPASWSGAMAAVEESAGWLDACSDDEILSAQHMLAKCEGIFCEPASAISVAGIIRDIRSGRIPSGSTVTCILTGNGLKDIDIVQQGMSAPMTVDADLSAVADLMRSTLATD